jgi:anti-sigma factor RsiW
MRGSQKRVTEESKLLLRFVDDEMSVDEAQKFRARLAESPALRQKLQEMQRVGALLRVWANGVEPRAEKLVEPTLLRVRQAERRGAFAAGLSYALAAALVVVLPWSQRAPEFPTPTPASDRAAAGAAIERIEAGDRQAQVFVVGTSSTPVVWLADDTQDDDDDPHEQDPG